MTSLPASKGVTVDADKRMPTLEESADGMWTGYTLVPLLRTASQSAARLRTRITVCGCHLPPFGVATLR